LSIVESAKYRRGKFPAVVDAVQIGAVYAGEGHILRFSGRKEKGKR